MTTDATTGAPSSRRLAVFGGRSAATTGDAAHWVDRLREHWARRLGLATDAVELTNHALPDASNQAIARRVLIECAANRPDLVVVVFADDRLAECVDDAGFFTIGPADLDRDAARNIRRTTPRGPDRQRALRRLERARSHFAYASEALGVMESLRAILLVQEFCRAEELPAIAVAETWARLCGPESRRIDSLRTLLDVVDPAFLVDLSPPPPLQPTSATEVVERHTTFAARLVDMLVGPAAPAVELPLAEDPVGRSVRDFYTRLPFNMHSEAAEVARAVRANPIASSYPDLHALLTNGAVRTVAEFGCGTGWLSCSLALHYGVEVAAVDFTPPALARGRQLAELLGLGERVRFVESDLFEFRSPEPVDLVVSLGVLHHTRDCRAAFRHIQRQSAGAVYVALYHRPGRRPFLHHFQRVIARRGEAAALEEYRRLDGVRAPDDQHLESWFRDQVLHPHETQHTLREVCQWLEEDDLELRSTSINAFRTPLPALDELFAKELEYEGVSVRALTDDARYFPGFFTVLAVRRTPADGHR
ncbi:MAG: class I SAM-dependent methyltransferase [Planctomycetes bacterium]|nr:class I SAM-dependent methyltransferase [Planctomycetota bacterium]